MYRVNQNITYHPNRGRWDSTVRFEEKAKYICESKPKFSHRLSKHLYPRTDPIL